MADLLIRDVKKAYGDNIVIEKLNMEIRDEEFMVFVGPSGCGKSTTLRMIAGLEEITDGEIFIGDKLVNDLAPKDRDIAMVFQNYALYPHMNVYDNMAFGLKMRKFPKAEIDRRVKEASEILGLGDLLKRKPKEMSGGQRQRVALGRAIVREPQAFLMDEPLSNLDAKLRVQMRIELKKLHERLKTTTIYVTHDQTEAMTMGDRIAVMNEGDLQQLDTPEQLYNNPANMFVAGFIGSPGMNFLPGRIEASGDDLFFVGDGIRLHVTKEKVKALRAHNAQDIVLGVRPEDISFESDESIQEVAKATVEVVEPLGAETYVYLSRGSHNFTARIDKHTMMQPSTNVQALFSMDKVHFFDASTEKAIR